MDVREIALSAGVPVRQHVEHRFFMIIHTSAPITVEKLTLDKLSRDGEVARDVESGFAYYPIDPTSPKRWGGFVLHSATSQTVRIATTLEGGDYRRFLTEVLVVPANTLADVDDIPVSSTPVLVAAANSNRRVVIVQNVGAANIRVGTANVSPTRGTRLLPNGSRAFQCADDVYAIREGSTDSAVAVSEEVRV